MTRALGRGIAILVASALALACVSACARGSSATPPYASWAASWSRWETRAAAADPALESWAAIDSAESALTDSLAIALATAERLPSPFADSTATRWLKERVTEALILGDPRFDPVFDARFAPTAVHEWNEDGAWTLPTVLFLLERARAAEALAWIDRGVWPPADLARRTSLELEAAMAAGDTLAAGERARRLITASTELSAEDRADAEEADLWSAVLAGERQRAEVGLARVATAGGRDLFVLRARRRLASLAGDREGADSFLWSIAESYPSAREARRLLPSAGDSLDAIPLARRRVLLGVAEAAGDPSRYLALDQSIAPALDPGTRRAQALRGARLFWKAKQYGALRRAVSNGPWRDAPTGGVDWGLLLGRTYRNTGVPDSMALWYTSAIDAGAGDDRATALWEWAREIEYLSRFGEADSLYGRFLDAGAGTKRIDALVRRGLCRYLGGSPARAARAFALVAQAESGSDRAAGEFWLARLALARGATEEARAHLQAATRGGGYYAARARSALDFERDGIALTDLDGYWRQVRALFERADLASARLAATSASIEARAYGAPDTSLTPEARRRLERRSRDLLLFRRHDRGGWAKGAKELLEAEPALGSGATRLGRLAALGFPDIALRGAFGLKGGSSTLRFPPAFAGAVADAARRERLAPEFLWSIMRRESVFESSVKSGAGAIGLMQLMPATAETTATRHAIPRGPLRAPRVNLRLGAAHLRDLLDDEPGPIPIIIAGYNAGIDNARRWIRPAEDPDVYIERIGYRETREYVMAVLDAFWTYREQVREAGE